MINNENMKKFILMLNGPMCAGKSTTGELLLNEIKNSFRVSSDKIKWLISNYSKDEHSELAYRLTLTLANSAFHEGLSLIIDSNTYSAKLAALNYKELAKSEKAKFLIVNIEAPIEVLTKRFKERLISAKESNSKISVTTIERMLEIYQKYIEDKDENNFTFDSSVLKPEEICKKITELINIE